MEKTLAIIKPDAVAKNVRRIIRAGAVGINFEDRIVGGAGLHPIALQAARIRAIRQMAAEDGVPLVLNARTDLFLGTDPATHRDLLPDAFAREAAYAAAGADCFFVPGLTDATLIAELVARASLPVNVMMSGALTGIRDVADLGIARISYGPAPFIRFQEDLSRARAAHL